MRGEGFAELRVLELVDVKWIGSGELSGFGVKRLIRGGEDQLAAGGKEAVRFGEQVVPVFDVLYHFEGDDEVERGVREWEGRAVGGQKAEVRRLVTPAGIG